MAITPDNMRTTQQPDFTRLSEEEREEPILAILELFERTTIDDLQLDVRLYLNAATMEPGWWTFGQPWDVHELQQRLEKLMEACWLLLQEYEATHGQLQLPDPLVCCRLCATDTKAMRQEYKQHLARYGGRVRLLRAQELARPIIVIRQFFHTLPLPEWKCLLTKWTEYALCDSSLLRDGDIHLLLYYEQLQKLLELAWVLYESEDENSSEAPAATPAASPPSPELQAEVLAFLQEVSPERLSHHLLQIYMGYLKYQAKQHLGEKDAIMQDILKLFNVLRSADLDAKGLYREIKRLERERGWSNREICRTGG